MVRLLLFGLPFLLSASPALGQDVSADQAPIAVLSYKWSKDRRAMELVDTSGPDTPQPAMIPQNKNFARNARVNDPAGVRDPNADTIDGRSEALEKSVQESRTAKPKAADGFAYKIKVQNTGAKAVEIVFWEYQFQDPGDSSLVARRQFLCGVNVAA